jgi:hypothetical protein
MLVLLTAAAKISAVKVGTSVHLTSLPCQSALFVPATITLVLLKWILWQNNMP